MQGMLGQFERAPAKPSMSVSVSQRPYSETQKAREITSTPPEAYYKVGMATAGPRTKGTGILGTGWGPGSKREYTLSPEAQAERTEAQGILDSPYQVTKRYSYKDAYDTTAEDLGKWGGGDEESIIEEAMTDNPGKTREEIIAALKAKGIL